MRKLLYLCDIGICYSVWVVTSLLVGLKLNNISNNSDCTHITGQTFQHFGTLLQGLVSTLTNNYTLPYYMTKTVRISES